MNDKHLHIVCFDIPFPANYGGAIDVYYRIKALYESGVQITLHCPYKGELKHHPELENLCEKVYYYPRKVSVWSLLSRLPLTVAGRPNQDILKNLLADQSPILYEGLVSCGTMDAPELRNRKKYFRECNVEHDYYRALAAATHNLRERCYYQIEARRLKRFENILRYADGIFALAHQDEAHFRSNYPQIHTTYLPCFHKHSAVASPTTLGKGILYHGNLRVAENQKAAEYIIHHIAPQLPDIPFCIAGNGANKLAAISSNVRLVDCPDDSTLEKLIREAQVHLLITFQPTGLKLKLLNVLYNGRHVVCNPDMVCGTELSSLCHIQTGSENLVNLCKQLYTVPLTAEQIDERKKGLAPFENQQLIKTLLANIQF